MNEESLKPSLLSVLIPRTRDGDEKARDELLGQLHDYLQRTAHLQVDEKLRQKTAVSDIVQLSFIRIIENFEQFRGVSSNELMAWIKQIVINEAKTARRKFRTEKRDYQRETSLDVQDHETNSQPIDKHLTPASAAIRNERIQQFHVALEELSPDLARVIQLRSLDRLPFHEIGKQMNRSEEAASQLWYRAIVRLEEVLSRRDESAG